MELLIGELYYIVGKGIYQMAQTKINRKKQLMSSNNASNKHKHKEKKIQIKTQAGDLN